MVKKKSKRLTSLNGSETNKRRQGSIKKYCTEKKVNKKKNICGKITKIEYLRNKIKQNANNSSPSVVNSKNNKTNMSLLNDQNDIILYEVKPLSPTKLSISVKKFYNNHNFKQYEENLHLYDRNKLRIKEGNKYLSTSVNHNSVLNEQTYRKTKKKLKYDMSPQLNKEQQYTNKNKSDEKTKSVDIFSRECNFENNEYFKSLQSDRSVTNETKSNEYPVEEYQVTKSPVNAQSISVKNFYKSKPSEPTVKEKSDKDDMPLISDNAFNSKADFNQSPSSKLNSSHKISLNLKHINDTTINKQQKVTAFFPIRRSARKTKNLVDEEKQEALEKAIASQNEDGLKVAIFPNKGRGIIAGRDFSRGEYVVEYAGELICLPEARKREAIYSQDITTGCYMYYFKYGSTHYCIDATAESSRLGRLVNHSRYGNLGPKIIDISGLPKIVLVAKIDIKQGEELTYDYGDRSKQSLANHPWLAN